uniref:tail fiber/spike domain-containing protein n=1 Tax=Leclercia sp. EC_58 TaxID=2584090 RepID=UPI002103705A|nr:hypothetical protein [Leclercia sp. EC_58]
MTIHATMNPLGSTSPYDLFDNAQNFDNAINSITAAIWQDRLGKSRHTWYGIESMALNSMRNYGYIPKKSFEKGTTLDTPNAILQLESNGEYYRWDGDWSQPKVVPPGSTPESTGGVGKGKWVGVGDGSVRASLLSDDDFDGDRMVRVKQSGNSVPRTVHDKMLESISIADYLTGGDVAGAIIEAVAATSGTIIVPPGDYTAAPTLTQVPSVLKLLSRAEFRGSLTINLPVGTVNLSEKTVIRSQNVHNLSISGVKYSTSLTGMVSVSGSPKAYLVTISLADASNVSVGDVVMIRHDIAGTGGYHIHCGGWVVAAVSGNNVTVKNTCHLSAFPTSTITGGSVVILKSILKYAGCDGFMAAGAGCIRTINSVAVVGDYDLASGTGTQGAHGFSLTTPDITVNTPDPSNDVFDASGCIALGPDLAIVGFGEQGFVASKRSGAVTNFISSCSNRKRGLYAEGAHIRGKFMLSSGNGEDGMISDVSGAIQANGSVCSGNGLNGFWSFNHSFLGAPSGVACGNLTNGAEARGPGALNLQNGKSYLNRLNGVTASGKGTVIFTGSLSTQNGTDGLVAVYKGYISAANASVTNNGRYGVSATHGDIVLSGSGSVSGNATAAYIDNEESTIIKPDGTMLPRTAGPQSILSIRNANLSGADFTASSIGDLTVAQRNTSSGSLTPLYVFKTDGTQHPVNDATQNLGRAANRYNVGFFAGGTQSTSDATLKDPIRDFNQAELNAAMRIAKMLGFWTWLDDASKRLHAGTTVQAVLAVLEEEGLDWRNYGFIGFDEWENEYAPVTIEQDDGLVMGTGEIRLVREAGSVWQLRDQEFDRFLMRGLAQRISNIEDRLK